MNTNERYDTNEVRTHKAMAKLMTKNPYPNKQFFDLIQEKKLPKVFLSEQE